MKQVLHIFRKDVGHLWLHVLIVLLLTAAHAVVEVRGSPVSNLETPGINAMSTMLAMLLPLGIWFLISLLIFQEALPGDRQFWLTRPYSWPKLLTSKLLFILVFINVPLFLSDCFILGVQGFPVLSVLPALLLRQVFMTVLFVLPSFALATVTTGIAQFLLAWFILLLALVSESMLIQSLLGANNFEVGSGSTFIATLAVTACLIVVWQYARRRTLAARLALFTVICGFMPAVWGVPLLLHLQYDAPRRLQSPNRFNVRIGYDLGRSNLLSGSRPTQPQGYVLVRLPLSVEGPPPKTLLRGTGRVTIDIGGTAWPQPGSVFGGSVEKLDEQYWQTLNAGVFSLDFLKQHPVNLHTSFDLEIVSDEVKTRVPITRRSFSIPGVGLCRTFQGAAQINLTCRAGLTPGLETAVRLEPSNDCRSIFATFMPPSVPWGLSPATDLGSSSISAMPSGSEFAFIPRHKMSEFQITLDLYNLNLARYILPH
jgi:hypothetical protein